MEDKKHIFRRDNYKYEIKIPDKKCISDFNEDEYINYCLLNQINEIKRSLKHSSIRAFMGVSFIIGLIVFLGLGLHYKVFNNEAYECIAIILLIFNSISGFLLLLYALSVIGDDSYYECKNIEDLFTFTKLGKKQYNQQQKEIKETNKKIAKAKAEKLNNIYKALDSQNMTDEQKVEEISKYI